MAGLSKNISLVNTGESWPDVFFGDVWYSPGGDFGPRVQSDYQLVIVLLGEARVWVDGAPFAIPPGSAAVMPLSAPRLPRHTCVVSSRSSAIPSGEMQFSTTRKPFSL